MFTKEDREKFEFLSLVDSFKKAEKFLLYKRLRQLRSLLYPYRKNYAALIRFHQTFQKIGGTATFWSNQEPFVRSNLQKNVNASLLNYLSSAGAVIDLSRSFSENELSPDRLVRYKHWIKFQFVERVEFSFIRALRNYLLHYQYLAIGVNLNMTNSAKMLYLTTADLLQWSGWNDQQRAFISGQDKQMDFIPIIMRYHDSFIKTQDLLFVIAIQSQREPLSSLIEEMKILYNRGLKIEFISPLPFRSSNIRYIQWLLSISDNQTLHKEWLN